MSRATSGRRSRASILSASSKVVSSWKRISGALRRPAFSLTRPRNHGAAQGGEQARTILAAERHDEGRRVAQVGTDIDRGHRDRGLTQVRVAHVAALQQLGKQVPDFLADAQLALAVASIVLVRRATPGHGATPSLESNGGRFGRL